MNEGATLGGRTHFDFLQAEDKGAGESWKHWCHAGGWCHKDTLCPTVSPAPLPAAPQASCPASPLLSLHTRGICIQTLQPASAGEKFSWDPNRLGGARASSGYVCLHGHTSQLCQRKGDVDGKCPQQRGDTGIEQKRSLQPWRGTREWSVKPRSGYWAKNVLCPFPSVCRACAVPPLQRRAEAK